ncbi:MAG: hypothetical protein WED01_08705, partial [Candidatus Rokuibacteriota bacterium]
RLDARTACPGWLGERLDVGWAIDVLHPLAVGSSPSQMADYPDDSDEFPAQDEQRDMGVLT